MSILKSMVTGHGQTHETKEQARSSAKPCLFISSGEKILTVVVLPSGFEPKPSEPESEILSIRLWEQKKTGANAAMRN